MKFKRREMPDGTVQIVLDTEADYSYVGRGEAPESTIDLLLDLQAQGLPAAGKAIHGEVSDEQGGKQDQGSGG